MRTRALLTTFAALLLCLPAALALAQGYNHDAARNRPGDFVINRPANLYAQPNAAARIINKLRPRTVVRVVEVLDQWYKVRSTHGHQDGFIRRSYANPYAGAEAAPAHGRRFKGGIFKLVDPVVVRAGPSMSSRKITTLRAGAEVRVVDKDPRGLWYKLESKAGNRPPGWIPTQAARRMGDMVN